MVIIILSQLLFSESIGVVSKQQAWLTAGNVSLPLDFIYMMMHDDDDDVNFVSSLTFQITVGQNP